MAGLKTGQRRMAIGGMIVGSEILPQSHAPNHGAPVVLSPEEREAIARSKAAAGRGEFATDEQVQAVWAKHGL